MFLWKLYFFSGKILICSELYGKYFIQLGDKKTFINIDVPQSRDGIRIVLPDRNSGPEISNFKISSDKCQDNVHAEDCKKIVIV